MLFSYSLENQLNLRGAFEGGLVIEASVHDLEDIMEGIARCNHIDNGQKNKESVFGFVFHICGLFDCYLNKIVLVFMRLPKQGGRYNQPYYEPPQLP
jgi:hypothetical protein